MGAWWGWRSDRLEFISIATECLSYESLSLSLHPFHGMDGVLGRGEAVVEWR
jgi:hypothetical protein